MIEGGSLISSAVYAPNINKRSANTVVVTPDGQPVVIGGLIANEKSSNDSKIPMLGDIPMLGQLFKFSAKSNQKNELLIFLTPHIVQMPSQLAAFAAKETTQSQLITNSISEQELDRFSGARAGEEEPLGSDGVFPERYRLTERNLWN